MPANLARSSLVILRAARSQGEVGSAEVRSLRRRLADAGGDVTEGHLKCLPSKAASCTSSLPRCRPLCALDALTGAVRFRFGYDEEPCSSEAGAVSALTDTTPRRSRSAATAPAPTNAGCFLTQPRKRFLKAARTSSILT